MWVVVFVHWVTEGSRIPHFHTAPPTFAVILMMLTRRRCLDWRVNRQLELRQPLVSGNSSSANADETSESSQPQQLIEVLYRRLTSSALSKNPQKRFSCPNFSCSTHFNPNTVLRDGQSIIERSDIHSRGGWRWKILDVSLGESIHSRQRDRRQMATRRSL